MAGTISTLIREALSLAKGVVILERMLIVALEASEPQTEEEKALCLFLAQHSDQFSSPFELYVSDDPEAVRLRTASSVWGIYLGERWFVVPKARFEQLLKAWQPKAVPN